MEGQPVLNLQVLGELTATRDGAVVDLGGRRQRAVLAGLAMQRDQVVPADRLVDCVWGDHPPANANGALQAYVSHLRKRLEPDASARQRGGVIARAGPGYVLRLEQDAVDAWAFERDVESAAGQAPADAVCTLDTALRSWRGPAYADYAGEPWAEAEIARLTELRGVARERLLGTRLELGEAQLVIGELEALVKEDPLREERWRLLTLALYRAHRQAAALESLRRARAVLADELGVDPGPALRALEAEVLAQSPGLDGPGSRLSSTTVVSSTTVAVSIPRPRTPDGLVERDHEVGVLRQMIGDLAAGSSGCLLVEGPAGIGKSRLLDEVRRLAVAAGVWVRSARSSAQEQAFEWGVVRQLFGPGADDAVGSADRYSAFRDLFGVVRRLADDAPFVICVDDVQWCDEVSLQLLGYLVRRLEGLAVLVVLAVRTGEPHQADVLAELVADETTDVLHPQPLTEQGTAALVTDRLGRGADAFVATCHRMTAGNPLLLRQLLRALADQGVPPDAAHLDTVRAVGSRAITSLVALRLRRMPPAVTAVARAVAMLGPVADLVSVAHLAQLPEEDVASALDQLARSEILRDGHPLDFVNPLVRDAIHADVPTGERALLVERLGRLKSSSSQPGDAGVQRQ
ncbi:DNA-binding SARP family transcriptional activator [Nocardioides sp. BE266]|uniref:BTAD domain-containing putative transcriptional regulator n=1 Tax=Nocardioides sp. BE266 TaxID=2817725 RepID=UPI0028584CB9|nr:BTAD domain-containing putative transcriptional regulator [Nocardioides sp. BE266]MDR7252286.1 DNA-binding SARP family transcriptional activator [Nocardioides sp. BE266]